MGHSRPRWKNAQRKSGQEDKGDAIPDELLGLVFLRLTSPLDLVRAAFACRSWRKVIAAEDFRVLSARHGAPSSIVAGHYHISFSHCHYRPSGLLPHFVPSSSSCWAGVAANNLALDFLPRAPNGDLSLELADSRGGLLLLADFDHTEHGKPFEQPSRLVVCDPLAGQYVTVPPPPAVSHTTFVSLFLGAALHGEDAAARISLSNYRVTCLIYHDGICKTCVFSPGPGGHAWTSSGAIVPLHATHTGLSDILFVGCNARFFQWYVFGGLGNFILALDRESGELSRFERARDEDWLHTVPIEMLGGPSRVLNCLNYCKYVVDMASSINFNQFLEKEKLKSNGSNFTDWFRHVRIFLNGGNLQYVLDAPLGDPPAETETDEVKNVYMTRKTRYSQVQCAILCSLESDLQKRFEHHDPHELIKELKTIFETHAAVECYEASKHFFSCMMEEGSSISEHMLVMTGHAKKLSDLGIVIPNRLGINRVLQSLPPSYKNFVMNYNMQNMNKEFPELFGMLKAAEIEIKKEHQVLMVNKTTSFKKQGKSKGKNKKSGKKAATPPVKPKSGPKPDAECYYCKEKGHWKRNCSKYLADLKSGLVKKKKEEFLTKEVTGRKVELDEIEESLLVDQSSAVPENVPVPPTPATEEANDNDHETSNETATEPRRSTRDRATPDWYDPCLNVMIVDNNDEDPATYEEAMMSPDSNKWQEAMKSEMGSMYDNKVWTLVELPDSRKAVENKWIFKRKTDADGNITVYKARLVAKGFRQIQGVDYDETFSPVAKLKSVRILLAIAAFFDYEIWQMDVKTAFLNGDIEEELYMVQPKGFVDPKNADKVCKLQRSIYGLKQASRSWNRRFDKVIKDFGFIQCHGEACIYKKVSGSSVAFLILYVDDILLIGNDIELLSSVKGYLNNSFSMKDLGEASYILGIKIYRDRSRRLIGLSQSTYLDKILKKFRMDESKKGFLPMLPGKVLSKTQGPATAEERERMSQIPYASAVGSIMYAMLCTRPDIAHAVSLTSRYQSDPGMEHWTAVKNILKYLKRTKDMFLCYGGDQELVVTSYTDASWNTDPDDSKSQSGYVFILNGAAVSWASSKQCTVAKSSTESEYIAASEASSEAVWMKRFIIELGVVPSALDPFVIYCDNMGAIANAQEPRSHKRLKHIKLRYHSIREYIEDGEVKICKVHTDLNVADPLTKALPRAKHDQHQNAMGVRYITM
ncbi:hypothetical protein QYE76_046062 [Lolium multiflorum]|uniref:CCHC-type domain-containing protein n=1 Tax=Lolium multiflorum TaxID=4521 RepID=A0AAD8TP65_LOLMU|nr:hypothetical protein QYE76_046062 [Lolium multiflorum]